MKKPTLLALLLSLLSLNFLSANGICIVDAGAGTTLQLVSSEVDVSVTDQIATVTMTATFFNQLGADTQLKFGFPMTETGSALSLEWLNEGSWYTANFAPEPQDTTLPGGGGGGFTDPDISAFLGATPLYFDLEQWVKKDSSITFRLVYVDLLPYAFNRVSFWFPNDYSGIQATPVEQQSFHFSLQSQRTIELVELLSHPGASVLNSGHDATVDLNLTNAPATQDFYLEYELNADELGIFPFSTYLPDSSVTCDGHGRGFFAFIVEPDPSDNTAVIQKNFTLIIDRSGSMGGNKMVQARDAASFIVNNLNFGDNFNLVAFDNQITSFKPDHVPYDLNTKNQALSFIANLSAGGSTNISGAFSEAIPDFQGTSADVYNVIVFFTDGQATAGITSTQGILNHVQNLIAGNEVEGLSIFTFGIGQGANQQLLTLLANNNNGFSEFLEDAELQSTISNFYLTIQNPVLLYPQMTFDPPIITETHPENLPNLFKGQQLIVVGRYEEPVDINVHFSGTAFGQPVEYDYQIPLADSSVQGLQFLPRLWAKQKMNDLYQDFFSYPSNSPEAQAIEDSIVQISICYGVISPFTSFEDDSGGGVTEVDERPLAIEGLDILLTPNPFRGQAVFQITTSIDFFETATLEIFDANGRIVKVLEIRLNEAGNYQLVWDGKDASGRDLRPGFFMFKLNLGSKAVVGKAVKI